MKKFTKFSAYLLVLLMLAALLSGCLSAPAEQSPGDVPPISVEENGAEPALDEYGSYTTKEDVALYIHTYGCLPSNFITKDQARQAGWNGGSLEPYCPGMCIGGTASATWRVCCPRPRAAAGPSATSIPWARIPGARSALSCPMTA